MLLFSYKYKISANIQQMLSLFIIIFLLKLYNEWNIHKNYFVTSYY